MSSFADFTLVFDVLVIVLLVITIVYAVILNRRLAAFRGAKDEIKAVMNEFASALAQAEHGMAALRQAADIGGDALQSAVEQASRLADDLAFLKEKGDATADRLEDLVTRSRAVLAAGGADPGKAPAKLSARSFAAAKEEAPTTEPPPHDQASDGGERPALTEKERKLLRGLEGLR